MTQRGRTEVLVALAMCLDGPPPCEKEELGSDPSVSARFTLVSAIASGGGGETPSA